MCIINVDVVLFVPFHNTAIIIVYNSPINVQMCLLTVYSDVKEDFQHIAYTKVYVHLCYVWYANYK